MAIQIDEILEKINHIAIVLDNKPRKYVTSSNIVQHPA